MKKSTFKAKAMQDSETCQYQDLSKEQLINALAHARAEIVGLKSDVASLQYLLFARKSERRVADPEGMISLFNEVEEIAEEDKHKESERDSDSPKVKGHKRRKNNRKSLPEALPRERREHDLSDKEKQCPIHKQALVRIGEKVREELEVIPAKVKVIEHVTFSYKCPCCAKDNESTTIISSQREPSPIPKSFASPSLLAYIATAKYSDALPLYRQEKIFSRYGIDLTRNTMSGWMIRCGELASPLINLMREQLLEARVLGCDETPLQVLKEPKRKPEQTSYMWVGITMCGPPVVLFNYDSRRSTHAAKNFLDGYEGIVVCDGLKTYNALARQQGMTFAGCLAHIRRGFVKAEKALKKADPKAVAKTSVPLGIIRSLYKIEREILGLSREKKLEQRKKKSEPLMEELGSWLKCESPRVLPKSLLGKAIRYDLTSGRKCRCF